MTLPIAAIAKLGVRSMAVHTATHLGGYALLKSQSKGQEKDIYMQNATAIYIRSLVPLLIIPIFQLGHAGVLLSYLASIFMVKQEPYSVP